MKSSTQISLFWWRWLVLILIGVGLFGLSMVLLPDVIAAFFNWMIFSGARSGVQFSPEVAHYIKFVYGVLGAVMLGWAITLLYVVFGEFRRGEPRGWNAVAVSVVTWFVVDSIFSWSMGFIENVIFNILFFVLLAIPLAATYRQFHGGRNYSGIHEQMQN